MDPKQLLAQFLDGGSQGSPKATEGYGLLPDGMKSLGGIAGGLAAGGLLGLLLGNGKARKTMGKVAGGIVGVGGAAALGALAYRAYRNWQNTRAETPKGVPPSATRLQSGPAGYPPSSSEAAFDPGAAPASDGRPFELALVKAMIAAANADRHIDAEEQRAIFDSVGRMPLDAEDKALVFDTIRRPPEVEEIAALARSQEQAVELYMASRLAIDPDHPAERAYLDALANRLALPGDLVTEMENQLSARAPLTA